MKKRKAKRRKVPTEFIRIAEAYNEQERIKEDELLKLIADIIVNASLKELYRDN
ncbi:hypothetical protein [Mucilaginibacter sp.]|uniref:hypothetical protein n=1 Tax=Mucilaginibacter sp. TaxID=1882438 RepID=UPI002ED54895